MANLILTIPALFGDHHTTAVKQILEGLDGITQFYISSAFYQVEADYDPEKITEEKIKDALQSEGYEEGDVAEVFHSSPVYEQSTRHTESVTKILSFAENAPSWEGRPLWPCPGFEYQPQMDD
jgi:copper chaperone CopZ